MLLKAPASLRGLPLENGNKMLGDGNGYRLRNQTSGLKQLRCIDLTIVALDGASDNGGGRVATDVVLRRGRYGAGDVAAVEDAGCHYE